ncbi:DUF397 domain-containing protein [Streptomyces sp. NPDC037389]|uniref:DUF397 domain-containing protein n=1 Tax=Streptomyces sp. NPDC037389 TaxID=3155369 RepID=UPI0033E010A1
MSETIWQKSSFSGDRDECVELGALSEVVAIRESDNPAAIIGTTRGALRAFILGVKSGEPSRPI